MSHLFSSPGFLKEHLHILVVDDEQEILRALPELIRDLRHACVTASDGMDALERLNCRRKSKWKPPRHQI